MRKPIVLMLGAITAVVVVLKRRQSRADAALWREATSDSSRCPATLGDVAQLAEHRLCKAGVGSSSLLVSTPG